MYLVPNLQFASPNYHNISLKSTCACIEFDKFKAKVDDEGPCSGGGKFFYTLRIDRRNDIQHQNFYKLSYCPIVQFRYMRL